MLELPLTLVRSLTVPLAMDERWARPGGDPATALSTWRVVVNPVALSLFALLYVYLKVAYIESGVRGPSFLLPSSASATRSSMDTWEGERRPERAWRVSARARGEGTERAARVRWRVCTTWVDIICLSPAYAYVIMLAPRRCAAAAEFSRNTLLVSGSITGVATMLSLGMGLLLHPRCALPPRELKHQPKRAPGPSTSGRPAAWSLYAMHGRMPCGAPDVLNP